MVSRTVLLAVSGILGVSAAAIGGYHGYGEILQGDVTPKGVLINAFGGADCMPDGQRNCFPAMTVLPTTFLIVGILTEVVALITLLTTVMTVAGKSRGLSLLASSIVLLLVGGGFLAPILGIVGAGVGWAAKRELSVASRPATP